MIEGLATRLLEGLGNHLWGFRPRLMREIVARLGVPIDGHAYAFELHYFRSRVASSPVDEHAIVALGSLERAPWLAE